MDSARGLPRFVQRYDATIKRGYVVAHDFERADGLRATTYWYGPDHMWGTTSGALSEALVWPTRQAAMEALLSVYRTRAAWLSAGYRVRSIAKVTSHSVPFPHDGGAELR
jgi:hypothetical protein